MTITLKDVGSGFKRTAINENFDTIESELNNNVLRRDSVTGSNQMEVDIDMNSQRLLNLVDAINGREPVTLDQLNGALSAASSGLIAAQQEQQTGADIVGSVTTFTGITYTVSSNNLYVFRNGVYQTKGVAYNETSTSSITWTTVPNATDSLVFITNLATTNSTADTSAITHSRGGILHNLATYLNKRAISITDYGAVGDGVTDDTTAVEAAISGAAQAGLPCYVPSGTYLLNSSAITTTVLGDGNFVLFGDGPTSILKLADGQVEANFRRLLYFNISNDIESLTIRDLQLDQNARGNTPPVSDFDYEQSHTVLVNVNENYTAKSVTFDNVLFKDPTADSMNNVSKGTIESFTVSNCKEIDRTRVRSSIQFSRLPPRIVVSNFTGAKIETENLTDLTVDTVFTISDCAVDGIDIAMSSPAGEEFGKLMLSNTVVSDTAFIGSCSAIVSDCDLAIPTTGRWNNLRTGNVISNSKLRLPYDAVTGAVTPFYPFASTADHEVTFNDCDFIINSLTVPTTPTGFLIDDQSSFSVANSALYTRKRTFNRCTFDSRAARSINCHRNGTWVLNDCKYGGTDYAVLWYQSTGSYVDLTINGGDFTEVTGDFLSGSWTVVDQSTTVAWLRLRDNFYGDAASKLATISGTITDAWGLENTRVVDAAALPTDGLNNDTVKLNSATFGGGREYSCTTASHSGSAVYRMTNQLGIKQDTTANRVSPVASDIGLMYMDTTLDADGHPIWWNGTAWVDAQGVLV